VGHILRRVAFGRQCRSEPAQEPISRMRSRQAHQSAITMILMSRSRGHLDAVSCWQLEIGDLRNLQPDKWRRFMVSSSHNVRSAGWRGR
jgi:hypothetical protein